MRRHKVWIFLNSCMSFISAYIFVKLLIVFVRFILIRFFEGDTQLYNFELECITSPYSTIWTPFSVISIYLSGFLIAGVLIPVAYGFYRKYRMQRGLLKLWFVWVYVIAIGQSVGVFIRDIPFSRDIYHALHWMYIPYGVMLAMIVLSLPALFFLNFMNIIRFLKMAPSNKFIATRKSMCSFYTQIALLPAIVGSIIITLLNINDINQFELLEKFVILLCIGIPYIHFLRKDKSLYFRRVKNDNTGQLNIFGFFLFFVSMLVYLTLKFGFY
jgi:hypothetical protein